jgi:hypothetical protein
MDRELKTPQIPINAEKPVGKYSDGAATTNVRNWGDDRATLSQRCRPTTANL